MTHQSPSSGLSLVPCFTHDVDWPFLMVTRVFFALLRPQVTLNEVTQVRRVASSGVEGGVSRRPWRLSATPEGPGAGMHQSASHRTSIRGVMSPLCQNYRQTRCVFPQYWKSPRRKLTRKSYFSGSNLSIAYLPL